jgi:hypothetical protein
MTLALFQFLHWLFQNALQGQFEWLQLQLLNPVRCALPGLKLQL